MGVSTMRIKNGANPIASMRMDPTNPTPAPQVIPLWSSTWAKLIGRPKAI